jgi:hypothetical protein
MAEILCVFFSSDYMRMQTEGKTLKQFFELYLEMFLYIAVTTTVPKAA